MIKSGYKECLVNLGIYAKKQEKAENRDDTAEVSDYDIKNDRFTRCADC